MLQNMHYVVHTLFDMYLNSVEFMFNVLTPSEIAFPQSPTTVRFMFNVLTPSEIAFPQNPTTVRFMFNVLTPSEIAFPLNPTTVRFVSMWQHRNSSLCLSHYTCIQHSSYLCILFLFISCTHVLRITC